MGTYASDAEDSRPAATGDSDISMYGDMSEYNRTFSLSLSPVTSIT